VADDPQQGIAQLRPDFHALQARMVQSFVGTAIAMTNEIDQLLPWNVAAHLPALRLAA